MEEQGIMSLPEGRPQIDPSLFDTEIKNIAKSDPKAFKNDLLTSLEEIDPQVVAEFKAELSQMSLSAEVIDALQVMVDEILASPEKYEEIRAKYLAQEVPEELLPAMFDPTFFGGLELALNELEKSSSASPNLESSPLIASPMPMADGGIATVAQAIASMGRRGDTMLAHITPEEAALLQRMGGSGTINPVTGLPEFFLIKSAKKIFKSAKSVVKGIGKAVNKLAKNDVGRIALTIAASYYMGPAGFNIGASTFTGATFTGVQTAAGSTLVSLAAGDSLKDSLKSGITAGLTAGFGQAFSSALPDKLMGLNLGPRSDPGFLRSGIGGALAGTGVGLARGQNLKDALKSGAGGAAQGALRNFLLDKTGIGSFQKKVQGFLPELPEGFRPPPPSSYQPVKTLFGDPLGDLVKGTGNKIGAVGDLFSMKKQDPTTYAPTGEAKDRTLVSEGDSNYKDPLQRLSSKAQDALKTGARVVAAPFAGAGQFAQDIYSGYTRDQPFPEGYASFGEKIGRGADVAGEKIAEYLPGDRRRAVLQGRIADRAQATFDNFENRINSDPSISSANKEKLIADANIKRIKAQEMEPGMVSMYGPAALGLGALAYAGGAFGEEEEAEAEMFDPYYSGMDYIRDNPQLFSRRFKSYTPYLYAKGGIAQEFPRKTGPINGPGTGTSDSIPAMLSDGEFVMTAKAVRNIGNGSRRKGAAKMYKMMKELEKRTA